MVSTTKRCWNNSKKFLLSSFFVSCCNNKNNDNNETKKKRKSKKKKKILIILFAVLMMIIVAWDIRMVDNPEDHWFLTKLLLQPEVTCSMFLRWVERNPYWGMGAMLGVIAFCVVVLIPIGTPLTLGCGYIYKGVYGWTMGIVVATTVSMIGSAFGAVMCFVLGRYFMRDRVRTWVRNYPLFDAIDMGTFYSFVLFCNFCHYIIVQSTVFLVLL